VTEPAQPPYEGPVAIYHALPHGLHGPMGERPAPSHFVDIEKVLPLKREMLRQHESQQEWLDASQGMSGLTDEMERMGREVGRMSGRYAVAEGFSKHWHLGFAPPAWDPLSALLDGNVQRHESR
jgi:LmbE family N-acetylglucosaminyl deacetylase